MKKDLSRNKSIDFVIDIIEDEEKKEKPLDWSEIDVNKVIMRGNSLGEIANFNLKHPKKPKKLSTFIERISPYLPDYLIQKFLEN